MEFVVCGDGGSVVVEECVVNLMEKECGACVDDHRQVCCVNVRFASHLFHEDRDLVLCLVICR